MSAQVFCIASGSGIPIFTRKKGILGNLPFSIIGAFNGVHMFTKAQQVSLSNTVSSDYCVVWKEYHDSILLIGISSGCTEYVLDKVLFSIYNTIVLAVGIEEVKCIKSVEKMKRELKVIYPVIDKLLNCLDCGDPNTKNCSYLVSLAETILCCENHSIHVALGSYTDSVKTVYACILVHEKIAVATEEWWELHPEEINLLNFLATSDPTTMPKDVPVFLPYTSPNVAYRLIVCPLIGNVLICCLADQSHSVENLEHLGTQCFKGSLELFCAAEQCFPRNFPESVIIDSGILGLLLINQKKGKYVMSSNPTSTLKKRTNCNSHRLDILRSFYYRNVLPFLLPKNDVKGKFSVNSSNNVENEGLERESTVGKETYSCSEYHKCYANLIEDNILCVMYNSSVPSFAMKHIAEKILKVIISDKQLCW